MINPGAHEVTPTNTRTEPNGQETAASLRIQANPGPALTGWQTVRLAGPGAEELEGGEGNPPRQDQQSPAAGGEHAEEHEEQPQGDAPLATPIASRRSARTTSTSSAATMEAAPPRSRPRARMPNHGGDGSSRPVRSTTASWRYAQRSERGNGASLTCSCPHQLKPLREAERVWAIQKGFLPDPLKPRRLDEATDFVGTCEEFCPEFEREEREYQNNVDLLERVSRLGLDGGPH